MSAPGEAKDRRSRRRTQRKAADARNDTFADGPKEAAR
jgi:hypothetical protein